jgi:hypothetical protein
MIELSGVQERPAAVAPPTRQIDWRVVTPVIL